VKGDKNIELLKTVPGVGEQTALAFEAHVDVDRFDNSAQVSNYVGLVPRVYMSGSIVRYGDMGKAFSVGARRATRTSCRHPRSHALCC
jgi:transposase